MVQAEFPPLAADQHPGDPRLAGQEVADGGPIGRVGDVDMRQLMVADGEGAARKGLEDLAEGTTPDAQVAGPAEDPIDQHRSMDVAVTVFADDPHPGTGRPGSVEQGCTCGVELADKPRQVRARGTEPLGVVVEVRQVDERQVGPLARQHRGGRSGDPVGRRQAGGGPPEGAERERTQLAVPGLRTAPRECP